jgi:hypothetical protein
MMRARARSSRFRKAGIWHRRERHWKSWFCVCQNGSVGDSGDGRGYGGPMLGFEGGVGLAYRVRGCAGRVLVGWLSSKI